MNLSPLIVHLLLCPSPATVSFQTYRLFTLSALAYIHSRKGQNKENCPKVMSVYTHLPWHRSTDNLWRLTISAFQKKSCTVASRTKVCSCHVYRQQVAKQHNRGTAQVKHEWRCDLASFKFSSMDSKGTWPNLYANLDFTFKVSICFWLFFHFHTHTHTHTLCHKHRKGDKERELLLHNPPSSKQNVENSLTLWLNIL